MNHSKAPWIAKGSDKNHVTYVIDADNKRVCTMKEADYDWNNCKLIAAAPDLLEALSFCQSVIKSQGMFDRSEQIAFEKAEAAIQKATK